jgi:hypothetical protein
MFRAFCENIAYFSRLMTSRQGDRMGASAMLARCRQMNIEKRALLDHAKRCRRVANNLAHDAAARRLRAMAETYEARAARLDDESDSLDPSRNGRRHFGAEIDREN